MNQSWGQVIEDIRNIFHQSWRFLIEHSILLVYSFVCALLQTTVSLISKPSNFDLLLCIGALLTLFSFYLSGVFTNYCIFIVYKKNGIITEDANIFEMSKKFFWKSISLFVVGLLLALLFSIPAVIVVVTLIGQIDSMFLKNTLTFILLNIIGFFFFGANELGLRMLLAGKYRIVQSAWEGLKHLRLHLFWYFCYYIATAFISWGIHYIYRLLYWISTGIDIVSLSIYPLIPYFNSFGIAVPHWDYQLISLLVSVFSVPYFSLLATYAYLNRVKVDVEPANI